MRREITYVPLSVLEHAFDERNPRAHNSLDLVEGAVDRLGFIEPIVLDDRTGKLVAGHGRVKALRRLKDAGNAPPEGVSADAEDDGDWAVPVTTGWKSRDDDEAARALVELNRATELSEWNDEGLYELLQSLQGTDEGLAQSGFDDDDMARLQRVIEASGNELDAQAEWDAAGMPDYESNDLTSAYRTVVHFHSDEDADEFFKLIDRKKATFFWWPENDGHQRSRLDVEVVADESDA